MTETDGKVEDGPGEAEIDLYGDTDNLDQFNENEVLGMDSGIAVGTIESAPGTNALEDGLKDEAVVLGDGNNGTVNSDLFDEVLTESSAHADGGAQDHNSSNLSTGSGGGGSSSNLGIIGRPGDGQRKYFCYVGNMTWWTTDQDLADMITNLGVSDLVDIKFYENRANGQSRGFALCVFLSEASMRKCMDSLKEHQLHGQKLATLPYTKQSLAYFEQATRKADDVRTNKMQSNNKMDQKDGNPQQQVLNMGTVRLGARNVQPPPVSIAPPQRPLGPPGVPSVHGSMQMINHQHHRGMGMPPQPPPGMRPPPPHLIGRAVVLPPQPQSPMLVQQRLMMPPGVAPMQPPQQRPPPATMISAAVPGAPPPMTARPPPGFPMPPVSGAGGIPQQAPPRLMPPGGQMGGPMSMVPPRSQLTGGPPPNFPPPGAYINPNVYPGMSSGMQQSGQMVLPGQVGAPTTVQPHSGTQPGVNPQNQLPPGGAPNDPPLSEAEFDEIMNRNRTVSSSAISRAVSDAAAGDYASAIETLVTAISLIRQSRVANDHRCRVLITSLQDTLHGIEAKSYSRGGRSSKDRTRERSRSPDRSSRKRHRRSRSRSRSRERYEYSPRHRRY